MPLFNFNDLPLILIISQCGLLALLLIIVKRGRTLDNALLAVFLLSLALEALDALMYWCQPLKKPIFSGSPLPNFLPQDCRFCTRSRSIALNFSAVSCRTSTGALLITRH
jgi:hypothetical protein